MNNNRLPYYVISKNLQTNELIVSTIKPKLNPKNLITLTEIQLNASLKTGDSISAQTRYRQVPFSVTVSAMIENNGLELQINELTEEPAIGQSCVLYLGDICLGGGIIS